MNSEKYALSKANQKPKEKKCFIEYTSDTLLVLTGIFLFTLIIGHVFFR